MSMRCGAGLLILLVAGTVKAGDWRPDPTRRYELRVSGASTAPESAGEMEWVQARMKGLAAGNVAPKSVYRLGRVATSVYINGERSDRLVFALRGQPDCFVVVRKFSGSYTIEFIVDFSSKEVLAANELVFVHPTKRFAVVASEMDLRRPPGIVVGGAPESPTFDGRIARWF